MGYVWVGYVWNGYVWDMCDVLDMCGVRYANNLLKNPATKRLSGKQLFVLEPAEKNLAASSSLQKAKG